jgi:hypothetical protein
VAAGTNGKKMMPCVHSELEPAVNGKKIFWYAVLAFLIFFVLTEPGQAANFVHHLWNGIVNAAHALRDFFTSL